MPWHKHKNSKLVTHYGRWTKQDENDFYNELNLEDWRGSSRLIAHDLSSSIKKEHYQNKASPPEQDQEVKDVDG